MSDPEQQFADDARRYRLDSRIATGGMGEVWRATDTVLGREVAVKVLKHEYADDPTFRARFETEAQHAAALHHPGVAGVYDFGEATDPSSPHPRPYLVMELVEGQPLSRLLMDGRALDREVVRDLMAQSGEALAAAHAAGIVHRDVKPANLLVTPDRTVKVTDFGIARAADGVGITQTGTVMGTAQYLSPEQARGERATPASDVYSLGVVTFECLTGRRPFDAESPVATALAHIQQPVPDLPDDVPADLAAVVHRALAKDPAERYPDGAAFAAALRDPSRSVPPPAAVVPVPEPGTEQTAVLSPTVSEPVPPPRPAEEPRRRTAAWLVPLLILLLAIGIVVAAVALSGDDEDEPPPTDPTGRPTQTQETQPEEPSDTPPPSSEAPTPSDDPTTEPTTPPTSEPTTPPTSEPTTPTDPTTPTSEPPATEEETTPPATGPTGATGATGAQTPAANPAANPEGEGN